MKRPLIFVQTPNALKNWLTACGTDSKVLYDLEQLNQRFNSKEHIVLIQLSDRARIEHLTDIIQQGFDVLLFSDQPSNTEGLELFKLGIKGYLNTFATVERIQQALTTIEAGSIWLGPSLMQAMIQSTAQKSNNNHWQSSLTERECQVAESVLESKTNREIAEQLEITERTVKAHMHNIFEKLGVSDRLSLALKIKNWH